MSISEAIRGWLLQPILDQLKEIQKTMAQDQAALDVAIKALGDVITSEDAGIAALITAVNTLVAKVQTNPSADFSTEITAINSLASDIGSKAADIQAAVAKAS